MQKRRKTWHGLIAVMVTAISGCAEEPKTLENSPPKFQGVSVRVGALEEAGLLAGVIANRGEWDASRGGKIQVVEEPLTLDKAGVVDVLLFSGDRLGDLIGADRLAAIPNEAVNPSRRDPALVDVPQGSTEEEKAAPDPFDFMGITTAYREQVTRYGNERVALPYGASAMVLVYRRDAFDREANQLAAKEKGIKLAPPKTWDQLDAVARFFQGRDWDGDGKPDSGIAIVLGDDPEGLGDATYLARAASLGQHPDQFSFLFDSGKMVPRIESPPFVEALGALVGLKDAGPPDMERFDAAAAREAFRSGKVAMLIDRAERASTWSGGKPVGVAALPGSDRVFEPGLKAWATPGHPNRPSYLPRGGGWLVGVRKGLSGDQFAAAIDLAKYLASPEKSDRIRAERSFPMLPFRADQMSKGLPDPTSAPDVDVRLWSESIGRTFAERAVPGLRIPDARGYLADLAKGRAAVLAGKTPAEAMAGVVRAWDDRTKKLGPKHQLWHYKRSLNIRGTTDRPPDPGT